MSLPPGFLGITLLCAYFNDCNISFYGQCTINWKSTEATMLHSLSVAQGIKLSDYISCFYFSRSLD